MSFHEPRHQGITACEVVLPKCRLELETEVCQLRCADIGIALDQTMERFKNARSICMGYCVLQVLYTSPGFSQEISDDFLHGGGTKLVFQFLKPNDEVDFSF